MLGYGRDESVPTPGGVFVAHFTDCSLAFCGMFVGILRSVLCVFRWCSWVFHGVFVALSQTVSSEMANRSQP